MLVLMRKKNEEIYIGDDIVVAILDVVDGKVRVGVKAPRDVVIMRNELVDAPVLNKGGKNFKAKRNAQKNKLD